MPPAPEPDRDDDAALLVASAHDATAFDELYRRHAAAVLAYHYRRTGCAHTAADLTAETFAQAFASRRRFHDTGAPGRAWLFVIAQRQLGRFARRERVSARYRRRLRVEPVVLTDGDVERIEAMAELSSMLPALDSAMAQLPTALADAVRLRVAQELPYAEVARRLGCSEGAARVRVSRALVRLADLMEGP